MWVAIISRRIDNKFDSSFVSKQYDHLLSFINSKYGELIEDNMFVLHNDKYKIEIRRTQYV